MRNPVESPKDGKRLGDRANNRKVKSYGLGEHGNYDRGSDIYDGPITQHEEYAITGKVNFGDDFGVQKHDHKNRPHSEVKTSRRAALRDSQRAHPTPRGFHVHPDHGPTGHDGP